MDYAILDSAGNTLASFADDELAARAILHAMVAIEPDAAEHLALLSYDDDGLPAGPALSFYDCPPPVTIAPSPVLQPRGTDALLHRIIGNQRRYVAPAEPILRPTAAA
jgi:hypothetical protein